MVRRWRFLLGAWRCSKLDRRAVCGAIWSDAQFVGAFDAERKQELLVLERLLRYGARKPTAWQRVVERQGLGVGAVGSQEPPAH